MSLKILLADDSMTAQNMGKKILVDGGYEVVAVSNGAAAVKKLAEFKPDLVIADVYMPGYNGLEICERIKKSDPTVPVLLSVGKLEPFRPEEGVKVHADGIIIKPFEATDLLAVTAKLAERVGMAAPQAAKPAEPDEESAVEAEQAEAIEVAPSAAVEEAAASEATSDIPAFGVEEFSPEAAPTFAIEQHQPDYVREFGLDPHDAPTTMIRTTRSKRNTEPSFTNEFNTVEEFQSPIEAEPMLAPPASLNVAINDAFSPGSADEPEVLAEVHAEPEFVTEENVGAERFEATPAAEVAPDEFEAKLAAAMAEYEAPADEHTEAVAPVTVDETAAAAQVAAEVAAPVQEFTTVAPVWTAEEAPLTDADCAVNLEQEFRAFAAVASGGAAVRPAIAPVGPLGDTSADDEITSIVEESKDRFFPSTLTERVNAVLDEAHIEASAATADTPITATETPEDEFVALEVDGPLADPTAIEVPKIADDWGASALEDDALAEPTAFADESAMVDQVAGAEPFTVEPADEIAANPFAVSDHADVPELLTHDVPTEWNSGVVLDEVSPAPPVSASAEVDNALFTPGEFVSPEAPFAHAAVEEVAAEQPISATAEMAAATMREAMADEFSDNLAAAQAAPVLDRAAISDAVERVMDRMKTDLVAQIAKELAAKLGK